MEEVSERKDQDKNTEEMIRNNCGSQSKARTVVEGEYKLKEYLTKTTITEAKQIQRECCWLCGETNNVKTEHYYQCKGARHLQRIWNAREEDLLSTSKSNLKRTTKFLEHVAEMFQPKWEM